MHSSPNREKMSPAAEGRKMVTGLRTLCPCCGGSMGIRAAFRINIPESMVKTVKFASIWEYMGKKPWQRLNGQKGKKTLRDHRPH